MYYKEFRDLGIDAPNRPSGSVKVHCPKCESRKGHRPREKDLSLHYDEGFYKCHSPNCDFKGSVKSLKKEYSRPEWKNSTDLPDNVVKYFIGRGISQQTLKRMQIDVDEKGNIRFNYFRKGELINYKVRIPLSDGKKSFRQHAGAEKILYNLDSITTGVTKCIITEGEMDVVSWVEAGLPAEFGVVSVDQGAPNPGDRTDGKLECIRNCAAELDSIEEFYLCVDDDAPGKYLEEVLIDRFGAYRCFLVKLPKGKKDSNDVLQDKAYELSVRKETLRNCLKTATPVPVPGIHTLDDEVWKNQDYYFEHGRPTGSSTYYPGFDENFTFLRGDITLITGLPNDGKGQFTRTLALIKSYIDGWKWAFYAPEDYPIDLFYDDMVHMYVGKSPYYGDDHQMSKFEYDEARMFIREHFFLISPVADKKTGQVPLPTNDWINERIRFLKLKYGINAYVKDPWNKISHDMSQRDDQYLQSELSKEKFFAMNFDAAFYIVHPKQMQKNKDGSYSAPDRYDMAGGAMFFNMFDNFITIYRSHRHEDPNDQSVSAIVRKIKKQKLVGRPGEFEFWYDWKSNRYFEVGSDYCPLESAESSAAKKAIDVELDALGW